MTNKAAACSRFNNVNAGKAALLVIEIVNNNPNLSTMPKGTRSICEKLIAYQHPIASKKVIRPDTGILKNIDFLAVIQNSITININR